MRPQKVVVEAPFVYGSRHKPNLRGSGGPNLLLGGNKSFGHNSRSSLKSQLSLNTTGSSAWEPKSKKKPRQHSHTFGARTNVMTTISPPRKPGRPKREVSSNDRPHRRRLPSLPVVGLSPVQSTIRTVGHLARFVLRLSEQPRTVGASTVADRPSSNDETIVRLERNDHHEFEACR